TAHGTGCVALLVEQKRSPVRHARFRRAIPALHLRQPVPCTASPATERRPARAPGRPRPAAAPRSTWPPPARRIVPGSRLLLSGRPLTLSPPGCPDRLRLLSFPVSEYCLVQDSSESAGRRKSRNRV